MFSLVLLLISASAARVWPADSSASVLSAIQHAGAGDTVELEPGEYLFRGPTPESPAIRLDRPITIRSRDSRRRAVLRGDSAAVLFAVTSSDVTLADLVVGKQASGGDERTIDVYFASGTQAVPASSSARYGGGQVQQTLASRGEILSARAIQQKGGALAAGASSENRVLSQLAVSNVDFTRSLAGTNIAFARGAYADVSIERSAFGRADAGYINAIVAVASAEFSALAVHRNTFAGESHVLLGSPTTSEAIGLNYWQLGGARAAVFVGGNKRVAETYCLDAECTRFGPVVDADTPTRAFASLAEAFDAQVRRIRVTDDIELAGGAESAVRATGTTIEGGEGCDGAPLVTVRRGSGIVAREAGALLGVRNLRVSLAGPDAVAFEFEDHGEGGEFLALFDGVSVLGDGSTGQVAVRLNAAGARVELEDTLVVGVERGAVVERGVLVALDATFVGSAVAAIRVETSTRQAGLQVSGSTFINSAVGIQVGSSVSAAVALREFRVTCSTFLFNARRVPIEVHDCARKSTFCAAALRHNTIVSAHAVDEGEETVEERALAQGLNHVERGRSAHEYLYAGAPKHFSLSDSQGRLSWASGALVGDSVAQFLVASYAPVRAECLVPSESKQVGSAQATVVSDVLEVRSDSLLHQCTSLGVRFRVAAGAGLPPSNIYGVSSLGTNRVAWLPAQTVVLGDEASGATTLEATLKTRNADERHQHRLVVVAQELLAEAVAAAVQSGAALVADDPSRTAARRLCVVCGSRQLPSHVLDDACGGSTANVRSSFEAAYAELGLGAGTGAPRHEPVGLLVFGTCVLEKLWSVYIDQNEHIEGVSESQRGTLKRAVVAGGETPLVVFTPRAAKASLRYMNVVGDVRVAPSSAQLGPSVLFSTIDGHLLVHGRSGGRYLNNDLSGSVNVSLPTEATHVGAEPVLIEANVFLGSGTVLVTRGGGNPSEVVQINRNRFGAGGGVVVADGAAGSSSGAAAAATVRVLANERVAKLESSGDRVSLVAIDNTFAEGASVKLHTGDSLNGGVDGADLVETLLELSGVPVLNNLRIDALSVLNAEASGAAILRNVAFEDIGASLNIDKQCADFEILPLGLDLVHSTIKFAATSAALLAPAEARERTDQHYWRRSDAALVRCETEILRSAAGPCACAGSEPETRQKLGGGSRLAAGKSERAPARPRDTDSSDDSNTLLIVGLVVGGILLLCLIAGCVLFSASRSAAAVSRGTAVTMAARAQPRSQESQYETGVSPASGAHAVLSAMGVRARTSAKKIDE